MPINVSEAIDSDTAERIIIKRFVKGAFVDGKYQQGRYRAIPALASVQQPTPKELQQLSEGERNTNVLKFICRKALRQTDDRARLVADHVCHAGLEYKIVSVKDWTTYGYSSGVGVQIQ